MTPIKSWMLGISAASSILLSGCINPYYESSYTYFIFEGDQAFCNDIDFELNDLEDKNFTCVEPVYLSFEEFRESATVEIGEAKRIENTGKVYGYGDYLFTIDHGFGIGVWELDLDLTTQIGYITIPGVSDVSILGNDGTDGDEMFAHLYANSYTDLVQVDILDIENPDPRIVRVPNVFNIKIENSTPELPDKMYFNYSSIDVNKGYIVGYKLDESSDIVYLGE